MACEDCLKGQTALHGFIVNTVTGVIALLNVANIVVVQKFVKERVAKELMGPGQELFEWTQAKPNMCTRMCGSRLW